MSRVFTSRSVTAFVTARRTSTFFEGRVDLLSGPSATRVQHICLALRDTEAEALADAHRDAMALIAVWQDQVTL